MKWTKALPKEDGWYWYKSKIVASLIGYVEIWEQKGKKHIYIDDELVTDLKNMEWAGPIPEPEGSKE